VTQCLLDTCLLIRDAEGTLPRKAILYIEAPDAGLLFSPVSIWEVAIKRALNRPGFGRPDFRVDPLVLYYGLLEHGYTELLVTSYHAVEAGKLPPIHKDPFDRLLIAQAQAEGASLLTADETVSRYGGTIIYTP
jgi:PIN domain nuclease of toxin-antitoxin system